MYYVNENIKKLNRIFDQNNRSEFLRLDLNENPGGLSPDVVDEILSEFTPELVSQYPETENFKSILADYLNTESSKLCLVNGSAEGIRYIIQAYTSENGKILAVTPSYFMFQIYSEMYNRTIINIAYDDDLTMNINNILSKMTDEIQLLILLNPNNPMGNAYSDNEFAALLERAKEKEITVLIDEAYHYFYSKSLMDYALNNEHVFVTRTCSKLFSMAGCRLGYVAGMPNGIRPIQNLCTPHNINVFALKFAEKLFTNPALIDDLIQKFRIGREYLVEELDKNAYKYIGDYGNFIFIQPKTSADEVVKLMKERKKILIKSYKNVGMYGDCLRVTIGEKKYMKKFVHALKELDLERAK